MSQEQVAETSSTTTRSDRSRFLPISPVGVVLIILWGFGFLLVVQSSWLVQQLYVPELAVDGLDSSSVPNTEAWVTRGCLLVTFGLLCVVLLHLHRGLTILEHKQLSLGLANFAVMLCCGLVVFGMQLLLLARELTDAPIVLDYSQTSQASSRIVNAASAGGAGSLTGDALAGRKLFVMSCSTCHGPTGDGLSNLAPSLRTSDFVRVGDLAAITQVIAQGRALADPANKSGKVMPAKGGNPFLKDQDIADLAAFVARVPGDGGSGAEAASTSSVALAKWVVPTATAPPPGMAKPASNSPPSDANALLVRANEGTRLVRGLIQWSLVIHAGLVGFLFLTTARSVFGWLLGMQSANLKAWFFVASWGWWVATASWLVSLLIFWW